MTRIATLAVVAALGVSAGCGSSARCYTVASACQVSCTALPGQVFTGTIGASGYWVNGDPAAIPAATVERICRDGMIGPSEAAACYAATPGPERQSNVTCDCQPWTVTDADAECAPPSWSWK